MGENHGVGVAVDRAQCIGNGLCVALAPDSFALDDAMKAVVVEPSADSKASLLAAAEACPTQAIYLFIGDESLYP